MLIYETARTIGACLIFGGALSLMSHLAGQMSVGSASIESLVGGGAALVFGFLLCLLGDIGRRLIPQSFLLNRRKERERSCSALFPLCTSVQNTNPLLEGELTC